ncbi:neprilysin-like [Pseudomyrmex gracilis]|uniref:neprilysin-like n=1 Tax=Pseudomyrmex gracilis TaxID=219809 RepID=UPI000994F6CD|nr:neprilysin-like [Pseudomyrmex gracilis]
MEIYRFFIVSLIALTYGHVTFGHPATNRQYTLCATDTCINTASEMLAKLNRTVDPCNDFYKFACGGWLQHKQANVSFSEINFLSELRRKTMNQLREILEAPAKPSDTTSLLKAKRIFTQCMDKENNEMFGISNLSAIVNSYGGWPIAMSRHEWNKKNLTWQNVSSILHKNEFDNGLYIVEVSQDFKIANSNVIYIFEPSFSYSRDEMIQLNNIVSQKTSLIVKIVKVAKKLINRTVEIDNLFRDALDIVHFEMKLAYLTGIIEETSTDVDTFIPSTIQKLQEKYDKQHPGTKGRIDWHSSIQELFASQGIAIEPSEKLLIPAYNYLINLVPLLERTPPRTIVNFMIWTLIRTFSNYIKPQKESGIARVIMGAVGEQIGVNDTRWMNCVNTINLKSAISHEYIKNYISPETIQDITEISTDIKSVVHQQIRNTTWMDEPTRDAALEKLEYMKYDFIKPEWFSDEAIDRYYQDFNVSTGYLETIINILKFEKKKMMNLLRTPVDKKQWLFEPTELEGYYSLFFNKIVFTAAFLQNPVYDRNRVALVNYGTLGVLIGHEINHAYDTDCRNYDKDGTKVEWWTQKTNKEYENITQCFIDHYNKYLVPGQEHENIQVNGQQTLDENMVDSAGIVAAYYAYKNRKARLNETDWRLQGLEDYSEDQIFFLTYAQFLCESALPEQIREAILWDVHSVKEIRIRGSFSNSREFSKSYNCSLGTPMNPEKKCALWF